MLKLWEIKEKLCMQQPSKLAPLVRAVIEGVEQGKIVLLKCLAGRHRSQAVASIASDELKSLSIPFEGPILLKGIKRTR